MTSTFQTFGVLGGLACLSQSWLPEQERAAADDSLAATKTHCHPLQPGICKHSDPKVLHRNDSLHCLCREHPELSEGLCVEMMTRQLAESGAHTLQHQVLTALAPWMENLSFRPRWEGRVYAEETLLKPYNCLERVSAARWVNNALSLEPIGLRLA